VSVEATDAVMALGGSHAIAAGAAVPSTPHDNEEYNLFYEKLKLRAKEKSMWRLSLGGSMGIPDGSAELYSKEELDNLHHRLDTKLQQAQARVLANAASAKAAHKDAEYKAMIEEEKRNRVLR
jgi:hypothetical protein